MKEFLIGDTMLITWVNSGVVLTSGGFTLFTGSETVVSTGTLTDSGNGHYFAYATLPDTPGMYVAETLVQYNGFPFKRRMKVRAITDEVD